jgi:hypothetical protein
VPASGGVVPGISSSSLLTLTAPAAASIRWRCDDPSRVCAYSPQPSPALKNEA